MGTGTVFTILLIRIITLIGRILSGALILRVLMSWIPLNETEGVRQFRNILYKITEPLMAPCRKILNRYYTGAIDFSPILAMILLNLILKLVISLLVFIIYGSWIGLLGTFGGSIN